MGSLHDKRQQASPSVHCSINQWTLCLLCEFLCSRQRNSVAFLAFDDEGYGDGARRGLNEVIASNFLRLLARCRLLRTHVVQQRGCWVCDGTKHKMRQNQTLWLRLYSSFVRVDTALFLISSCAHPASVTFPSLSPSSSIQRILLFSSLQAPRTGFSACDHNVCAKPKRLEVLLHEVSIPACGAVWARHRETSRRGPEQE